MTLSLAFSQYGDNTASPLIILHGLLGSQTNWRSLSKQFARQHLVYTVDLRNHGASPWHNEHNYLSMAEDVAHFIEQHQLVSVSIIGHSMGGKVAMALALTRPDLIHCLVVADIAPVNYAHTHQDQIEALQAVDLTAVHSRQEADLQLSESVDNSGIRMFLLQNLVPDEGSSWRWRVNIDALNTHMLKIFQFPELTSVNTVTSLFVYGGNSDYVDDTGKQAALNYFPNAQFAELEGAGHWLHAEKPKEFMEQVLPFLTVN